MMMNYGYGCSFFSQFYNSYLLRLSFPLPLYLFGFSSLGVTETNSAVSGTTSPYYAFQAVPYYIGKYNTLNSESNHIKCFQVFYFILFVCVCVYFPIALLCFLLTFYVLSYVTAQMILPTYFLDMHLLVFVLFSMLCSLDGQIDSLFAFFFLDGLLSKFLTSSCCQQYILLPLTLEKQIDYCLQFISSLQPNSCHKLTFGANNGKKN